MNNMAISIKTGGTATSSDVERLEATIGAPIDDDYRKFLTQYDGGTPEPNIFPVGSDNDADVSQFIPVRDIPSLIPTLAHLPARAFPVAHAAGGNFIIINSTEGGAVYFWDHELSDHPVKLADRFNQFLQQMTPFDINSVPIPNAKVTSR